MGFLIIFVIIAIIPILFSVVAVTDPLALVRYLPVIFIVFPILVILLVVSFVLYLIKKIRPSAADLGYLQQHGERAVATVVSLEDTGITMNKIYIGVRITLQVLTSSRGPFTSVLDTMVSRVQIPQVGDQVSVLFDPQNTDKLILV